MKRFLSLVSIVVEDYDEAIDYYTGVLNYVLTEDTYLPGQNKRWVVVSPSAEASTSLLLARANDEDQKKAIGNQTGGRVFLFLETDDFQRDYNSMKAKGVQFLEQPRNESYGTVVVFKDLYGNKWDLIERKSPEIHATTSTIQTK